MKGARSPRVPPSILSDPERSNHFTVFISPVSQGQNGPIVNKEQSDVADGTEILGVAGESFLGNTVYVPCPWNCPSRLLLYVPALIWTSLIKISSMSTFFTKTEYIEGRDWVCYIPLSLGLTQNHCSIHVHWSNKWRNQTWVGQTHDKQHALESKISGIYKWCEFSTLCLICITASHRAPEIQSKGLLPAKFIYQSWWIILLISPACFWCLMTRTERNQTKSFFWFSLKAWV